jgi:CUG-BP- and ETR3-like factor
VGSLPVGLTPEELRVLFAPFGELADVHVLPPKGTRGQGCAFVKYSTQEAAWAAVQGLHDKVPTFPSFPGHSDPMLVRFADSKAGGKGGPGEFKRPRME